MSRPEGDNITRQIQSALAEGLDPCHISSPSHLNNVKRSMRCFDQYRAGFLTKHLPNAKLCNCCPFGPNGDRTLCSIYYPNTENSRLVNGIFSIQDIELFQNFDIRDAGILMRKLWKERSDKNFISRFTPIHWGYPHDILNLIKFRKPNIEISCVGYKNPPFYCSYVGGIGAVINGDVTLAGNGDLGTSLIENGRSRIKITTAYDRLFGSERYCTDPHEFTLSNWNTVALVVDAEKVIGEYDYHEYQHILDDIHQLAQSLSIKVYNCLGTLIN